MNSSDAETRPGSSARGWMLLALAFVAAFVAFRSGRVWSGANRPAEFGWDLRDTEGRRVEFRSYRGKVVFLNIWATWCGPCLREMPSIARLAANPRLKDVAFVGVSVDEDPEDLRRFVEQRPPGFPVLHAPGRLPGAYLTDGIPATFLIGRDGRIAREEVGAMDWDAPEVVEQLEKLLRAPGPT